MFGFTGHDLRLVLNLTKMMLRDRYLGSSLGSLWAILNPLFLLAIFTFIFGFVFQSRIPGAETTLAFVVWMISGYGPWLAVNESLMSSANSVVGSAGIVKNIPFKTELLPIAGAFVGIVNLCVTMCFLVILKLVSEFTLSWAYLFTPIVVVVQFTFLISLGTLLAALAVFVRDIVQMLPTVLLITLFMTPIFYSADQLPKFAQIFSDVNPFHQIISAYRNIFLEGVPPSFISLGLLFFASLIFFKWSLSVFRRGKGFFDSML